MTRILVVCLGNICRSPTAEAVLAAKIRACGLDKRLSVDSAGTAAWHTGKSPDSRSQAAGKSRGYDLSGLRARAVIPADFDAFDYILAMDKNNLAHLDSMKPAHFSGHLGLFLAPLQAGLEVPDPYHGDAAGFETVLDLIEAASDRWLTTWRQ